MSKEIFLSEIDDLLVTLAEQWKLIRAYPDKVPYIELDIFADNIRKLYEDVYLIGKLNKTKEFDIGKVRSEITTDQPVRLQTKFKSDVAEQGDATTPTQQPDVVPALLNEVVSQTGEVTDSRMVRDTFDDKASATLFSDLSTSTETAGKTLHPVEPQKGTSELFGHPSQTFIGDKHKSGQTTIGEKLKQPDNDNLIGSKMPQSPVGDLKSIIGINDKFLFINELFKGDMAAYNIAIAKLNACQKAVEANSIMQHLKQAHQMNEQSVSFKRLKDILLRRFPV